MFASNRPRIAAAGGIGGLLKGMFAANPAGTTALKTVVKPSATGGGAAAGFGAAVSSISKVVNHVMEGPEKEWTCWCGHKFTAAGEWYPTESCYCEAPKCPNPTFFLDGKGALMLEAKAAGKDPHSVGGGSSDKTKSVSGGAEKRALPKSSMGGRFK